MIELTLFRNLYDNKTDKRLELSDFSEFENLLYKLSSEKREGKRDSNLMSPACYTEGTNRRCNANVSHWSAWAAMDVDDHNFSSENLENELRDGMAIITTYVTLLLAAAATYRSSGWSSHYRQRLGILESGTSGMPLTESSLISEIHKLKTSLACITYLQRMLMLTILSSLTTGALLLILLL